MLANRRVIIPTALIVGFAILAAFIGDGRAQTTKLNSAELERLSEIAVKCNRDNSGVPDTDTCVPVYDRLIRHYGSYRAFVEAMQARKAKPVRN